MINLVQMRSDKNISILEVVHDKFGPIKILVYWEYLIEHSVMVYNF